VVSSEPVIESTSSNEACLTAADIAPPAAPSGLTALGRAGALEIRWTPSLEPDLALYRVYRANVNGTAERLAEVPAGTTVFADTTALAGQAYRYTVTAVDRAGNESAPSAPLLGNAP
jgi:fibronectin type 3 domain-containing protein